MKSSPPVPFALIAFIVSICSILFLDSSAPTIPEQSIVAPAKSMICDPGQHLLLVPGANVMGYGCTGSGMMHIQNPGYAFDVTLTFVGKTVTWSYATSYTEVGDRELTCTGSWSGFTPLEPSGSFTFADEPPLTVVLDCVARDGVEFEAYWSKLRYEPMPTPIPNLLHT